MDSHEPASLTDGRRAKPRRAGWAIAGEKLLELVIRLCGVSAIVFVLSIFYFVFVKAAPLVFSENFSIGEFLFSTKWYPTPSRSTKARPIVA